METNISNSISALSVLFGVAVFHLGASATKISDILAMEEPAKALVQERKNKRGEVVRVILANNLPNLLMLGAIVLVMAPQYIVHVTSYEVEFWNFDFMVTLYQIIGTIVVFYFTFSFSNMVKLIAKWWKLK